jgi:uncharacterized membrane protein YeaQ/YmgE (transglycosylase-associated protein family)
MTLLELVLYLIIAGVCGGIARAVAGGSNGGFVLSVLLGFLGAYFGTRLARLLHLPPIFAVSLGGHPFPIVWSIAGGIVVVVLAHLLAGGPRHVRVP